MELAIQAGRPRFVAYLEAFPMSAKENRSTLVLRVRESPGSIRQNIAQSAIFVVIVGLGIGPWMALASLTFFAVIFPMGSQRYARKQEQIFDRMLREVFHEGARQP